MAVARRRQQHEGGVEMGCWRLEGRSPSPDRRVACEEEGARQVHGIMANPACPGRCGVQRATVVKTDTTHAVGALL